MNILCRIVWHVLMLSAFVYGAHLFSNLWVKPFAAHVKFPSQDHPEVIRTKIPTYGDYTLDISMPMSASERAFAEDSIDCAIVVRIESPEIKPLEASFSRIRRYATIVSERMAYYSIDQTFQLPRGPIMVAVRLSGPCDVSRLHEATVSLVEPVPLPTERALARQARIFVGILLIGMGILGSILFEVKKARAANAVNSTRKYNT